MLSRQKRPHEVVDLTGDDSPQAKYPRTTSASQSSQGSRLSYFQPSSSRVPSSSYSSVYSPSQRLASQADPFADDDEPNMIDLTQTDEGPALELYGTIDNKIVGVRYYNGVISPGELVVCRREPSNPYDSNAIRVDNVTGTQVGHVPRKVAERLAPYIDNGDIVLEGLITGEKAFFDCPIRLTLYGRSGPLARENLEQRLKADKLLKATQLKATRPQEQAKRKPMGLKGSQSIVGLGSKEAEPVSMEQLLQHSVAMEFRSGNDNLKALAMDEDQMSKMPMAAQPEQMKAQLLPYQLQGLAWLRSKESPQFPAPGSENAVQLWKRDAHGRYTNIATNFTTTTAPSLLSGGILADDMGLGKTLQILSLIVTSGPGSTLIVAPLTVLSNWQQQAESHVLEAHALKVFIYHRPRKPLTAHELMAYDIVITTYGALTAPYGAPLFTNTWRRIVLDEGHIIRNSRTKSSVAACKLKAESRWILTGTPIINLFKDLHSMVKFLHITGGIEDPAVFNTVLARPLGQGNTQAEVLLQSLMSDLCLRRRKDMKFVDLKLPPKTEYVHKITFLAHEKFKYDALLSEAKGVLEEYQSRASSRKKGSHFQSVLERLLRLRQTCNHWTLCKQRITDLLKTLEDQEVVILNERNRKILQQALRLVIESQEECPICIDQLSSPLITHCKHVFCGDCIRKVVETQGKCPMCRNPLSDDKLLEPAPETTGDEVGELDTETKSSKTEALLHILQATLKNDGSKVIVFSQWTSFLSIVEQQLKESGYHYTRIDGSMTAASRDASMRALDQDPNCRILLASLAVCSVGLNLVAADTVVLADSWWAPAIEDQAVDRVHRLGQTRPTTVWRLVMEGTVEERVLDIQAEKRKLVTKAFQEKGKNKKTTETRMADIMKLLT